MKTHATLLAFAMFAATTPARAQTIVTPVVAASVNTTPGFIDLDDGASGTHAGFGVAVSRLTEGWLGIEGEFMLTPSAFSGGDLVQSSHLLTATASVLAIAPTRWGLRPYVSIGVGVAQIKSDDVAHLFAVGSSQLAATIGTGAWKWLTPRVGVRAGIDFLRTVRDVDFGPLETWRPTGGVSIKF